MRKEVENGTVQYSHTTVVNRSSRPTHKFNTRFSGRRFLRSFDSGMRFTFVTFIFTIFFVLTVTAFVYKGRAFTFSSLLDFVGSYDGGYATAYTTLLGEVLTITSDWGLFNFLRDFFNTLLGFVSFIVRAVGGLIDVFHFLWNAFLVLLN